MCRIENPSSSIIVKRGYSLRSDATKLKTKNLWVFSRTFFTKFFLSAANKNKSSICSHWNWYEQVMFIYISMFTYAFSYLQDMLQRNVFLNVNLKKSLCFSKIERVNSTKPMLMYFFLIFLKIETSARISDTQESSSVIIC